MPVGPSVAARPAKTTLALCAAIRRRVFAAIRRRRHCKRNAFELRRDGWGCRRRTPRGRGWHGGFSSSSAGIRSRRSRRSNRSRRGVVRRVVTASNSSSVAYASSPLGHHWRFVLRRRRWRFGRPFGAGFSRPSGVGGTVSAVRLSCGVTGGAAGGERRGGVVGTVVSAVPALPSEAAEAAEAAEAVEASFEELLPLPAAPASPTPAAETAKAAEATAPLPAAPAPPSPAAEAAERDEAPAPLPAAPAPFSPVAVVAEAAETPAPSPAVPVPPPPAAEVAEVAGAAETAGAGRDATLRPMER